MLMLMRILTHFNFRLTLKDEMLLTLIKIRRNFDDMHLATIYNINTSYVSRLLAIWIPFLAKMLESWIMWVLRFEQQPVPCFALFPRCVGVLDCFELYIEKPGSKLEQQAYWSEYKHHHTVKFLVCVAPNGTIMYLSPAYGGRTSDNEIVKNSNEGFLRNLMHGDQLAVG